MKLEIHQNSSADNLWIFSYLSQHNWIGSWWIFNIQIVQFNWVLCSIFISFYSWHNKSKISCSFSSLIPSFNLRKKSHLQSLLYDPFNTTLSFWVPTNRNETLFPHIFITRLFQILFVGNICLPDIAVIFKWSNQVSFFSSVFVFFITSDWTIKSIIDA